MLLQLSDYRIITRENIAGDTTITFEIVMVMIVNNNSSSNLQKDMSLFTSVIILLQTAWSAVQSPSGKGIPSCGEN